MSQVAWLDYDGTARERALQLLAVFQEKESRDELGLATIRDAISDVLFPGTSTIMTRLRYMLFVPWIFKALEDAKYFSASSFLDQADAEERKLIKVLNAKYAKFKDNGGVIGARAGENIKRLPSDIYWAGLAVWGIRLKNLSIDEYGHSIGRWYAEKKKFEKSRNASRAETEYLGSMDAVNSMWCATLPKAPKDFPKNACFDLTKDEASFIREHIMKCCRGSLLAMLAKEKHVVDVESPWMLDFPEHRAIIHQAKMFAVVMNGATILYNLFLARHYYNTIGTDQSRDRIRTQEDNWDAWARDVADLDVKAWNLDDLFRIAPRATPRTRKFIREWVSLVCDNANGLLNDSRAISLIKSREFDLKHERSRFVNRKALEQWNGQSGGLFNYRWHRVKQLMKDLYAGMEAR